MTTKPIHYMGHLLWILQSMEGLSNGNEKMSVLAFLIIDANSPYELQALQKMSQIWMNSLLPWIHAVQTQWRFLKMYIAAGTCQNLKLFFRGLKSNECIITENIKRAICHQMKQKIVHPCAMDYQNLNVIHKSSKKILTVLVPTLKHLEIFNRPSPLYTER